MFPSVLTFLGTLPVYAAVAAPGRPLGLLDVIGALVALGGTLIEAVADRQLHRFLATEPSARAPFLATGLWAHSRHPNYLGELMLWWGLCLSGLAARPGAAWVASGAVAITLLFATYSARAMDRRMLRREGFAAHMTAVPALVPGASLAARVAKGVLGLAGLAALIAAVCC
jgi:steroid 5-alpha reductase family enzyme